MTYSRAQRRQTKGCPMCGIVGLFLKDKSLEPQLGELMSTMLSTMCERGPDSAGFAVYGAPEDGQSQDHAAVAQPGQGLRRSRRRPSPRRSARQSSSQRKSTHAVLTVPADKADGGARGDARRAIRRAHHEQRRRRSRSTRKSATRRKCRSASTSQRWRARMRSATRAWRPKAPSPRWARIRSRPGPTSASCTTARCRTTTTCAAS